MLRVVRMHKRGMIRIILQFAVSFCPNSIAMAYCLRALPLDAVLKIEEMRRHWVDLAGLRAAGGTPSARCLKGFELTNDGWGITIKAKSSELHVRRAFFGAKNPCRNCAVIIEMDRDCGGDCDVCQIRWTWTRLPNNTVYFSRLGRRCRYWD